MVDEAQQLADYEMATREIMGIFEDPVFGKINHDVEMQEIDFWVLTLIKNQWYLFFSLR